MKALKSTQSAVCRLVVISVFAFAFAPASFAARLVLVDGNEPSVGEVQRVAEWYGLDVERVDPTIDSLSRTVARMVDGAVGVAISYAALPRVHRAEILAALQRPGAKIPLLIFGITADVDRQHLEEWSDGVITECRVRPGDSVAQMIEVSAASSIAGALSGRSLPAVNIPTCAMQYVAGPKLEVLLAEGTEKEPSPLLVRTRRGGVEIFFMPGLKHLDRSWKGARSLPQAFSLLAPYLFSLAYMAGDRAWHLDGRYANLTIDDPWLRQPYGGLNYKTILPEMERHNFHTTVAFVPWNFDRSEPDVIDLFRAHATRFSISIHGNDHNHREFGAYERNTLTQQITDIRQAIARMERFRALTGLPYDRFMIFPQGVAPLATFEELRNHGFLGTANSLNVPLGSPIPDDPLFVLRPYTTRFGNLLSLFRYTATSDAPHLEIAIESFLGNPLLFYGHEDLFAKGIWAFNDIADFVNRIQPDTQWRGLGDIARHLYLIKRRDSGGFNVRMLSHEMILKNPTEQESEFYVEREEAASSTIRAIRIDNADAAFGHTDKKVIFRTSIPAHRYRTIQIVYANELDFTRIDIGRRDLYVSVLRWASDFRDIYLSQSPFGRFIVTTYYSMGVDALQRQLERVWPLVLLGALMAAVWYRRHAKRRVARKLMATGQRRQLRACCIAYTFYHSDGRVLRYNKTLAARGDTVDVITLREPGRPKRSTNNGVTVIGIQTRKVNERSQFAYLWRLVLFFIRAMWIVSWRELRFGYDVIHIHSVPDFLIFAAWLPKLLGTKLILDIHDLLPELYASKFGVRVDSLIFRLLLGVERLSCGLADHVITANDLWQQKLTQRSVRPEKATVLLNYPDLSVFSPRGRTRSGARFIIIYPGSLNWHQGVDLAIEALGQIRDKAPTAELHIYGSGPALSDLTRLSAKLGLEDRVLFCGMRPLHEIAGIIENADLGVVPKRTDSFGDEAFSTKTLEFMALGVPVTVSDSRIDTYYFSDSIVRFFRGGDAKDLARVMLELFRDRQARETLRNNGLKFVRSNSWDVKKTTYICLLDSLCS